MSAEIVVREFRNVQLGGGTIVEAIPSVGLVSTIAATYLISALELDQVAAIDSDEFPPLSMIYSSKPKFPARVYASESKKLAVFICEIPLPNHLHRPLARTLMSWAAEHGAKRIVGFEGLALPKGASREDVQVWAVGSTDAARDMIAAHKMNSLEGGMITGVTGVLLNEGRWTNTDMIALVAEARTEIPDAFAAAKLVEGLDLLMPEFEVDLVPLLEQAKSLESQLLELRKMAVPVSTPLRRTDADRAYG